MSSPNTRRPFAPASACPRCGSASAAPFAAGGVCLRCAGARVLAFETGEPASHDSFGVAPSLAEDRSGLPARIGAFEIIEELGRGGMARVFAARQIGLGRIVALKTIPAGQHAADLELRFLREAQTVARLRHPHIVGIHESGRANGFAYFSMDYIEGGDLAQRLRRDGYAPRAAAELMHKVAGALAYTHGEGVLHRDLKPSNILLDNGEPRLADFGLAAQLETGGDLTSVTSILGTPHYVAPEALRGGSAALTVQSDLYALGVILYEMLTLRTPYAGASPAELPALIDSVEPPSVRLLAPAVPRDLETICLKCLERDSTRRYPSATALAEDLRRFLAGEAIIARPPGRLERLTKYARRHRASVTAATAIALVLIGASTVSATLAVRARRAEAEAASDNAVSREIVAFLRNDLLAQAAPAAQPNRDLPLRTVLDNAAKKLDGHFRDQPRVEAALRETLALTYESLGEYQAELVHLKRAIALRRELDGPEAPATLKLLDAIGTTLAQLGRLGEADPVSHQVVRLDERVFGPGDPVTLHAMNNLVFVCKARGNLAEAEAVAARTLERARAAYGPEHNEARDALSNLSSIYYAERKLEDAERLNVEAVALQQRVLGPEHPDTLVAMSNLAAVYWAEDKFAEAEKMNLQILDTRRRVLGPEHPETLRTMSNLATTYTEEGKGEQAVALLTQVWQARRRLLGTEHADTLSSATNLSLAYLGENRLAEASELCTSALATAQRVLGPEHFLTLSIMFSLGRIELAAGRLEAAETHFSEVLQKRLRKSGPTNPQTTLTADALGEALIREKKFAAARAVLEPCLAARMKTAPANWRTLATRSALGEVLTELRRFEAAGPMLRDSHDGLVKLVPAIPGRSRDVVREAGERLVRWYRAIGQQAEADALSGKLAKLSLR